MQLKATCLGSVKVCPTVTQDSCLFVTLCAVRVLLMGMLFGIDTVALCHVKTLNGM